MKISSAKGREFELDDSPAKVTAEIAGGRGVLHAIAFRGVKKVTAAEGEEAFVDSMPGRIAEFKEDRDLFAAAVEHFGLGVKKRKEKPPADVPPPIDGGAAVEPLPVTDPPAETEKPGHFRGGRK